MGFSSRDFEPVFNFINAAVERGDLSTAVFGVAGKNGVIDIRPFGERPDGRRVGNDDIYLLYSVTKPIVAFAIMQLWERGMLHPGEPVTKYIPEFAVNGKEAVTIWHLLTHTSGLNQEAFIKMLFGEAGPEMDLRKEAINTSLIFQPGEYVEYNNAAFDVMAEIVRRRTGMDLDEFMEENIFKPLDMRSTSFTKHIDDPDRVVPMNSGNTEALKNFSDKKTPAGGLFSNAEDLLKLGRTILNDGRRGDFWLIKPNTLKAMRTPQTSGIPRWAKGAFVGVEMGLCWHVYVAHPGVICRNIYGHDGMGGCMLWIYPEAELVFAFMTNGIKLGSGFSGIYLHNVFSSCLL